MTKQQLVVWCRHHGFSPASHQKTVPLSDDVLDNCDEDAASSSSGVMSSLVQLSSVQSQLLTQSEPSNGSQVADSEEIDILSGE